jgi:C-terminal processing protease CtpA/Prc
VEANDYETAAEFASRFVAKDKPLFSLRGTAGAPSRDFTATQNQAYVGLIAVLVDGETAGATETLAGVLRQNDKAILIGQPTAGRPVVYSDSPLPGGSILRIAVAQAILPEHTPPVGEGIEPDLSVALATQEKEQIFQQSLSKGMAPFVFEADQPHLNEAALLAGTNPEIELSQQRRARAGENSAQHDTVLQRAIDLVTSIEVYEKQPGRSP